MYYSLFFCFLVFVNSSFQEKVVFTPSDIELEKNVSTTVRAIFNKFTNSCQTYVFNYAHGESAISYKEEQEVIIPLPNMTLCEENDIIIDILSHQVGSILVGASVFKNQSFELLDGFFKVTVVHVLWLDYVQQMVGWFYFLAWSLSFYPQVISNYQRKSVVGLSFDYTFLNFIGFFSYTIFNISLYWVPVVQRQYHQLHPRGKIPVELNDVAFSIHAFFITLFTIIQCFIYERGNQTVSKVGRIIIISITVVFLVTFFSVFGHFITWLMFVTIFSYVKLFITSIKYFPQLYLNFTRKSTEGWCLGNVVTDFIGGVFSFTQMILIASNNNDWTIIYGNITKLGLGLAAMFFDMVFFIQHGIYGKKNDVILYESL